MTEAVTVLHVQLILKRLDNIEAKLDDVLPRLAIQEERLRQLEHSVQLGTWERRTYGVIAAIAAALGVKMGVG